MPNKPYAVINRKRKVAILHSEHGAVVARMPITAAVAAIPAPPADWTGDITGNGKVDTDDLLALLSGWGILYGTDHLLMLLEKWGPVPPTSPPLVQMGHIELGNGSRAISNFQCGTPQNPVDTGIMAENDKNVGTLTLVNGIIHARNYGLYLGSAQKLVANNVRIYTYGGGNNYCVRGSIGIAETTDCLFDNDADNDGQGDNKGCVRIYYCQQRTSTRDKFYGGRLMNGGGADVEWESPGPYSAVYHDPTIDCDSIEDYGPSQVTYNRAQLAGSGHIARHNGSGRSTFNQCKKGTANLVKTNDDHFWDGSAMNLITINN